MAYIDYLNNFVVSLLAGAGLIISTEKLIVQVNFVTVLLIVISSLFFSYGVYSLIKDFPKIIEKIKESFKK